MKERIRRTVSLLRCAASYWSSDGASNTGAALAFYCAFSIAPLLVILLTLAGFFMQEKAADAQIAAQLAALFGPSTARILLGAVHSAQRMQGVLATVVSVVTLLIGATTVFSALQGALEIIWKSDKLAVSGIRGWIRTRLLSLGFILTLGFLLLVSLTLSSGLSSLRLRFANAYPALVNLIGATDSLASIVLVATLFTLIYRYMPSRHLRWRTVVAGGVLTAVLFEAGRSLIGLYLSHSTQPSAYGAASSFAALLLWLYYTAQIFLFGAEFTSCMAGLRSADDRNAEVAAKQAMGPPATANESPGYAASGKGPSGRDATRKDSRGDGVPARNSRGRAIEAKESRGSSAPSQGSRRQRPSR